VLVTQGYLRAIPRDPVNGNKAEWKAVLAKEGGISDVRSLSNERGANGTPYADW
jgi:general secretion pathway protein G